MGAVDSPIWWLHVMDVVWELSGKWWWSKSELCHTQAWSIIDFCLYLLCPQTGERKPWSGLDHWVILVGFAHSCCKVPWLLRERQQCGEPEPLIASFLVVLTYCLVLGHKGWNFYKAFVTVTLMAGGLMEVQVPKRPRDLELGRKHVLAPGSGAQTL